MRKRSQNFKIGTILFMTWVASLWGLGQGIIKGVVKDSENGKTISGAFVLVIGSQKTAATGGNGQYLVKVNPGSYQLLATATGYTAVERTVVVKDGETVISSFSLKQGMAQFGEELVVLGSRTSRTAIQSPVPIDVLTSQEIKQVGMTETSRALQFLAPSFNHSTSTISDGTDIVRPSTLRGLGPDQTLVLLNGKRRHNSALVHVNGSIGRGASGVDLNAIPPSAIGQMEVLRDGASAQYGSDAIAGVINVGLKRAAGTEVNFYGGETFEGDGDTLQVSLNHGWVFMERGFLHITAEYRDRGNTNRAGLDPRQQYDLLPNGDLHPNETSFDRLNHRYGDADSENVYFFLNGGIPIGENGELYFFGGVSQRDGESGGFYRRSLDNRNRPEIHPDGFLPLINTEVDDRSFSVGFKTLLGAWSLDTSATMGGNSFNFNISNSLNASVGNNPSMLSDEVQAALTGVSDFTRADAGSLHFNQTTLNLDLAGRADLGDLAVNMAFGLEWREDNYEIEAGDALSYIDGGLLDQHGTGPAPPGIQVFPGFRPSNEVDESRDNLGLYIELDSNLTDHFLVNAAVRYEDYSDFGDNLSFKLATRIELSKIFSLRGSASTGFRAPSLHQYNFNNTSTQFVTDDVTGQLVPFEVGTFRNGSEVTNALGVPALEEETSQSFSLGLTARPMKQFQITIDAFKIDIDDRIVVSGQFQASNPDIGALLPDGVNSAQFFSNAIDTETEGVDVVMAYIHALASGAKLRATMAANWNQTEVVGNVRTPARLASYDATIFDRIERERMETAQPRNAANLGLNYTRSAFAYNLRFNYFGSVKTVESNNPDAGRDQVHSGEILTDLNLSYTLRDSFTIQLGGNNIFDIKPDEQIAANSFNGIFPYSRRTAPFGFNGGLFYLRLGYTF